MFTKSQLKSLLIADREGRALVTSIGDRVVIVLPKTSLADTADQIARITEALKCAEGPVTCQS